VQFIAPDALDAHWEVVSRGLRQACKRGGGHYTPEQVRVSLETGAALLYACPRGFVILQVAQDPDGYVLFVFAIHGDFWPVRDAVWAWLRYVKSELGCKRIRWESKRKAWARWAKLTTYVYEME
jgi:hypothetical protein